MSRIVIKEGQRFGRLVILKELPFKYLPNGRRVRNFLCKCDCGNIKDVSINHLCYGGTKSCGCLTIKYPKGITSSALYRKWAAMKQRCFNPKLPNYKDYGGRGITMCDEWRWDFMAFRKWSLENGYSRELSIDRIDNDGNYEPSNCRWATRKEQMNNRRCTHYLTFRGETHTIQEWSKIQKIKKSTIEMRLRMGWSVEKTLSAPLEIHRKYKEEEKIAIKEGYRNGMRAKELAQKYNISISKIYNILNYKGRS